MTHHPVTMARTAEFAAKFGHVRAWVFDLDNTLYPHDSGLWPAIEERITHFLVAHSGLDGHSARALQRYYYQRHGTTLRGLVDEDGVDPARFLEFVHDIDRSTLPPNPALGEEIAKLPGRKLIFTSGSRDHAMRTIAQLGLSDHFEDAFDIVASDLVAKPARIAYDKFLRTHKVEAGEAAMFEDIARNLVAPKALGMTTTLVTPKPGQHDYRQPHDRELSFPPAVDFITDDLTAFLGAINAAIRSQVG